MLQRSKNLSKFIGSLNGSITKGKGNIAGFLGEEIVMNLIPHLNRANGYDYDLIYENTTVDVKSKRCTSTPKEYYECSVADFNTTQRCDVYAFTRILSENGGYSCGWFVGWLLKKEFYEKAIFHKKGEIDSSNDFTFKADCYNIPIYSLNSLDQLVDHITISSLLFEGI